jgi:hypothetical protein
MKKIESFCQIFCVSFLHKLQLAGYDFLVWSTPNGGSRNKAEAGRMKLEGLLPGVPDLTILAKGILHFIEFKTSKGALSPAQKSFIATATKYGFRVDIVVGDAVAEVLPQVAKVIASLILIDQNSISSISAKILEDAARFKSG